MCQPLVASFSSFALYKISVHTEHRELLSLIAHNEGLELDFDSGSPANLYLTGKRFQLLPLPERQRRLPHCHCNPLSFRHKRSPEGQVESSDGR